MKVRSPITGINAATSSLKEVHDMRVLAVNKSAKINMEILENKMFGNDRDKFLLTAQLRRIFTFRCQLGMLQSEKFNALSFESLETNSFQRLLVMTNKKMHIDQSSNGQTFTTRTELKRGFEVFLKGNYRVAEERKRLKGHCSKRGRRGTGFSHGCGNLPV